MYSKCLPRERFGISSLFFFFFVKRREKKPPHHPREEKQIVEKVQAIGYCTYGKQMKDGYLSLGSYPNVSYHGTSRWEESCPSFSPRKDDEKLSLIVVVGW